MVRDVDRPVVVVKWLAEFDNRRECRSEDKTHKRVKFCQIAKLEFRGDKICYLEEYAQAMTGPGVRWPGIGEDVSDDDLAARIRMDPPKAPKKVVCDVCHSEFASRTQLFRHLKSTEARVDGDGIGRCVPIEKREGGEAFAWICMSLGYTCSEGVDEQLLQALIALTQNRTSLQLPSTSVDSDSLTWAVPPSWSFSAVVNVASIKLSKILLEKISIEALASELTDKLQNPGMRVHTAVLVDRPCVPERREFEKYEAFIPWSVLQNQEHGTHEEDVIVGDDATFNKGWSKPSGCRKPLSEAAASQYVDPEMAKRLRNGSRLLRDCGRTDLGHFADTRNPNETKLRVRASTMDEPWHQFCRISISMRQPRRGIIERIIALLLQYARSSLSEEDLVSSALKVISQDYTNELSSSIMMQDCLCTKFVCLLEPALTKYEGKIGTKLCGDGTDNNAIQKMPKEVESSITRMEVAILAQRWRGSRDGLKS